MYAVMQGTKGSGRETVVAEFKTYGGAVRFARGLLMIGERDIYVPSQPS